MNLKKNIFRVERLFNKITKQLIPKGKGVVKLLSDKIFNRMDMAQMHRPIIQSYVKQRLLIRMKFFNQHSETLSKNRKAKAKLKLLMT